MRSVNDPSSRYVAPEPAPRRVPTVFKRFGTSPFCASLIDCGKLTTPAPPPIRPPVLEYRAPICSAILTCAGEREGYAFSNSAAPPVTTGAAMLVPLRRRYAFVALPATCHCGYVVLRYDLLDSSETMRVPGASRSGLTARSYRVGPRELYGATVSSDVSTVPCVSSAPTVIAYGELPGDAMPPRIGAPVSVCP